MLTERRMGASLLALLGRVVGRLLRSHVASRLLDFLSLCGPISGMNEFETVVLGVPKDLS